MVCCDLHVSVKPSVLSVLMFMATDKCPMEDL